MKHIAPSERDLALFRAKLVVQSIPTRADLGPCWEWTASCTRDGYGQFKRAKRMAAHQLGFEWLGGMPISDGLQVLHHCDNRKCCRPDHLYLGTQSQNVQDAFRRGRMPLDKIVHRGEANGIAKLTEKKVLSIRSLYAAGEHTQAQLAEMFGCGHVSVYNVIARKTWRHVA